MISENDNQTIADDLTDELPVITEQKSLRDHVSEAMKRYFEETGDVHLAISEAGKHRFRPVLMTTVTTVLGLLPMLLPFGENYVLSQALAASVVGGMISSTILTLFVMPLLFYVWNGDRR